MPWVQAGFSLKTEADGSQAYGGPLGFPVLNKAHQMRKVMLKNREKLGYHFSEKASGKEGIYITIRQSREAETLITSPKETPSSRTHLMSGIVLGLAGAGEPIVCGCSSRTEHWTGVTIRC